MLFTTILMVLLMLASLTIASEYSRTKSLTLLSIVSLGNILYIGVTPALHYYLPESARIFEEYVEDVELCVAERALRVPVTLVGSSEFQVFY